MRAVTLWEPWATLIALGAKKIETRSWAPPAPWGYRLAIHAAAKSPRSALALREKEPYLSALRLRRLSSGAVVGTCRLARCVDVSLVNGAVWAPEEILSAQERAFGDYSPGRFAWILEDVRALSPPVPAKGRQWLWTWEQP